MEAKYEAMFTLKNGNTVRFVGPLDELVKLSEYLGDRFTKLEAKKTEKGTAENDGSGHD